MNTENKLSPWIRSMKTGIVILGLFIFSACKKEDPSPGQIEFYKIHRVQNLYTIQKDVSPTELSPFYYSLDGQTSIAGSKASSNQWDIRFDGVFNGYISANISGETGNPGTAKGGIVILEKSFEEVTEVPSDEVFRKQSGSIGPDNLGAFGKGMGWFIYDFEGKVVRNGSYNNQHVAYALGNPMTLADGTQVKPRTIVVKTARGNFAKIKISSVYKDRLNPSDWFRDTEKMYLTFEYVLVPAGSETFEIK